MLLLRHLCEPWCCILRAQVCVFCHSPLQPGLHRALSLILPSPQWAEPLSRQGSTTPWVLHGIFRWTFGVFYHSTVAVCPLQLLALWSAIYSLWILPWGASCSEYQEQWSCSYQWSLAHSPVPALNHVGAISLPPWMQRCPEDSDLEAFGRQGWSHPSAVQIKILPCYFHFKIPSS